MAGLISLESIIALQAAYVRCIDSDALEAWPDFFTEDCLYKVTTAENQKNGYEAGIIYADTRRMLIDRVAALREANVYERQSYRHILGLPTIVADDGAGTQSETPFLVVRIMRDGHSEIFASGVYRDTFVAAGNDLKLARRIVVCDSSRIDTLMALPL